MSMVKMLPFFIRNIKMDIYNKSNKNSLRAEVEDTPPHPLKLHKENLLVIDDHHQDRDNGNWKMTE